jgi:hypothetical protein
MYLSKQAVARNRGEHILINNDSIRDKRMKEQWHPKWDAFTGTLSFTVIGKDSTCQVEYMYELKFTRPEIIEMLGIALVGNKHDQAIVMGLIAYLSEALKPKPEPQQ